MDAIVSEVAPFDIRRPAGRPGPLIFASPHSGRLYPEALMAASALDAGQIRRSEDAHVDALIEGGLDHGATLLLNRYARAYVDVNREPWEMDPAMFEDELPDYAQGSGPRIAAGLGSIARIVGEGQEIYARKLTVADAMARIETVHRPWHQALEALITESRARHGRAIVIDWHSMPSAAARTGAGHRCDFVLGDRFGAACAPALTQAAERCLAKMGYRVSLNTPYAGGYTTERYGRPHDGVQALQIEISRALYLNEDTVEPTSAFAALRADLGVLSQVLAEA